MLLVRTQVRAYTVFSQRLARGFMFSLSKSSSYQRDKDFLNVVCCLQFEIKFIPDFLAKSMAPCADSSLSTTTWTLPTPRSSSMDEVKPFTPSTLPSGSRLAESGGGAISITRAGAPRDLFRAIGVSHARILPLSIIPTLLQIASTSAILCVANNIVRPDSFACFTRNSLIFRAVITSNPIVGSSRNTTFWIVDESSHDSDPLTVAGGKSVELFVKIIRET